MMWLQGSLGGRHHAGHARIKFQRDAEGATECLEDGLGLMVRVVAGQIVDVQRHQGVVDEALEKFADQIDFKFTDGRAHKLGIEHQSRTPGNVQHHARQCLIQRYISMAVTAQAFLVRDCLIERLPQRNTDVFNSVVSVDMQIALGVDVQINQAVARDLVQHVLKERQSGIQLDLAGTVEIQLNRNLGLKGIACNFCATHDSPYASWLMVSCNAATNLLLSSVVPTVTLRQSASAGCPPFRFLISTPRCFNPSKICVALATRNRMKLASLEYVRTPTIAFNAANSLARSCLMRSA